MKIDCLARYELPDGGVYGTGIGFSFRPQVGDVMKVLVDKELLQRGRWMVVDVGYTHIYSEAVLEVSFRRIGPLDAVDEEE